MTIKLIESFGGNMGKNVILIGMPGSGKSTIGKLLAKKLGMEFYDMDEYIEKAENKSILDMFQIEEEYFRDAETKASEELSNKSSKVISTGGGVVKRKINIDMLKKNGIVIFLNRPLEIIKRDINTNSRPLLKDSIELLNKLYKERLFLYKKYCDYEIINNGTPFESVKKILHILRGKL